MHFETAKKLFSFFLKSEFGSLYTLYSIADVLFSSADLPLSRLWGGGGGGWWRGVSVPPTPRAPGQAQHGGTVQGQLYLLYVPGNLLFVSQSFCVLCHYSMFASFSEKFLLYYSAHYLTLVIPLFSLLCSLYSLFTYFSLLCSLFP